MTPRNKTWQLTMIFIFAALGTVKLFGQAPPPGKYDTTNYPEDRKFINSISSKNLPNLVFVDNTSSEDVVAEYSLLFNNNISIVTCNKKGNSSSYEQYSKFKRLAKKNNVSFLYETNVGAGLPIIKTLNDLWISGDEILKIEAILSF